MADKEKKEIQQPNAVSRYYRETVGELKKVSWPSRNEAFRMTLIVLAVMVFTALLLYLFDLIGTQIISLILGLN